MRLIAFIAKAGVCARRKAGGLIKDGRVKIGGKVVREPWRIVGADEEVSVDGRPVRSEKEIYIVINKPRGVTSTVEDKFARVKVTELVPRNMGRLYPVGRLDKESRGLQILTNDGNFCYRLTHPKFGVEKEYRVVVNGPVDEAAAARLKKGVYADGEFLKAKLCRVERSKEDKSELSVVVQEGKKRHLRRLFKGIGLDVMDLKRVRIGGLNIGNLKEGTLRQMKKEDIYRLVLGGSGL